MSVTRRRVGGAIAALLLLAGILTFSAWRLYSIGREGWAGLSYYPGVPKAKKTLRTEPMFAMPAGAIILLYPDGPADRAGLRRGERIVAIDGIKLTDVDALDALDKRVRRGDVVVYRIDRGPARDVPVRFGTPLDSAVFVSIFSVTSVVALIYLAIGLFVFWRRPRDARAVIFFVMTLCAASTFVNASLIEVDGVNSRGFAMVRPTFTQLSRPIALASASVFFAPLLLHLALIFPRRRPVLARGRVLWQWIYGYPTFVIGVGMGLGGFLAALGAFDGHRGAIRILSAVCGVLIALAGLAALVRLGLAVRRLGVREGLYARPFASMTFTFALIIGLTATLGILNRAQAPMITGVMAMLAVFAVITSFASYPLATFVALLRSYRESGIEERRQVKWPLWGTMIAVGARVVLYVVGTTVGFVLTFRSDLAVPSAVMIAPDVLARLMYLFIPFSFAFAILKYRLMNIDVIIRRTVLYSILSAIVLGVYIALVAGVGSLIVHYTAVRNQTLIIGATIFVGLIAIPLRNKLQHMVDRNLFRGQRDHALALRNISTAIGGGDLHPFLKKSAEEVQQTVQNRFVLLFLRSETHYVAAGKVGIADEVLGTLQIPVGELPEANAEEIPALKRLGTDLVMSLRAHGDVLGIMALGSKLSDQQFEADDLQFLAAAAQQIALGIENVRLRSEEADFAQARAMQQILLPTRFPTLEGFRISGMWQPARSVGGDYFDTIAIGEGKVAVCIADVAGKGMPAALMMANLQAAVKATAAPDVTPAQLCDKVKRVVAGNLAGGTFITFFYGVVDAGNRTFTYSNAGHNPPILVRDDGSVERLSAGGPALCRLFLNDLHAFEIVSLQPGDRLVLFTDGASEARRGEEEFGEDQLVSIVVAHRELPADRLQNRIADAIGAFSGGSLDDDLTLVVVSVDR